MSVIRRYINNLKDINKTLNKVGKQAVIDNSQEIINLLSYGQLEKGLDAMNRVVGTYAATTEGYADRDNISKPKTPGMPYNFYWTGDTRENLKVNKIVKGTYEITTLRAKKILLENLYGDVFSLTKTHNEYINKTYIEPALYKYIHDNIRK